MKDIILIQPFIEMFKEASEEEKIGHKFLQYIIATWATGLFLLAMLGISKFFFEIITNPEQFNHITWGLIDYIP